MAKESTFANMVICLSAVCLVCSALLGGVYVMTKKPIEEAVLTKTNNAIGEVVPKFDNKPSDEKFEVESEIAAGIAYPAKSGGKIVGYAIETSTSKGFGGAIKVMIGFDMEGNIVNTKVISHAETPGLGAKMTEEPFKGQFTGKNPVSDKISVSKDGGDIDAITASTITSRAYCDAVMKAYSLYEKIMDKQLN